MESIPLASSTLAPLAPLAPVAPNRLLTYLSFVRFSHSVFALPFALTGALLAWREAPFYWSQVAWVMVAMVSARSAAMGFNRLVDARFDALNPRTAMREIPRGAMSRGEATVFVVLSAVIFIFASVQLNAVCGWLSPVALGTLIGLTKVSWGGIMAGAMMLTAPMPRRKESRPAGISSSMAGR